VLRAITSGDTRGERGFVFGGAAEFVEGERDRADLTLAGVRHQGEKGTGIDPCREKNPDLDIRQQVGGRCYPRRRAGARRTVPARSYRLREPIERQAYLREK
jgi:hypothetical protein